MRTAARCAECGNNCSPKCGRHPAGCLFGGFSFGYWSRAEGCSLEHVTTGTRHTFTCEACGERMWTPNYTLDNVRLCSPCYEAIPIGAGPEPTPKPKP